MFAIRAVCLALAALSGTALAGFGNDDCSSAQVIAPGSLSSTCYDDCTAHFGCVTDFDWYRITVPAGAELVVELRNVAITGSFGSPFLNAYDGGSTGACPAPALNGSGWIVPTPSVARQLSWTNTGATSREIFLEIYVWTSGDDTYSAMSYELFSTLNASPCLAQADDAWSPNYPPFAPQSLTDTTRTGLFVRYTRPDMYRVLVPGHGSFTATATFVGALGDIDMSAYNVTAPASTGTGDSETLTWTNPNDFAYLATFLVHLKTGHYDECNTYDLTCTVDSIYGTEYCPAADNSQGVGAQLLLSSPPSASALSWTWWSFGTRPNSSILLYCGPQQISVPFGDGVRCVGGSLFRLRTTTAGSAGHSLIGISAASLPIALQFQAGATWNFQTRYRDLGGPLGTGFNLSNGVSVTFTP